MSVYYKYARRNRENKWKIFCETIQFDSSTSVLNVGFTSNETRDIDNYLEKKYPYLSNIVSLGVEDTGNYASRYPQIKTIQYDGRIFPFADKEFDVCWSNAVIEHVGYYDRQLLFIKEIHRVSKKAFITTPNRCFPVEIHSKLPFAQYLPKPYFDKIARMFNKHWVLGEKLNPLSKRQLKKLLKDAGITDYKIKANWFGLFIVDYIVTFS